MAKANKTVKNKTKTKIAKKPAKKTTAKSKTKAVSPVPKGYNTVTPYLIVNQALNAIAFYKKVFNAKTVMCMKDDADKVAHAELQLGDTKIMLADEHPEMNAKAPGAFGGSPVSIHLYIPHVDAVVERALEAGAVLIRPVQDMFYGDRSGGVLDPFGHTWYVSTHIEDVTPAELKKRAAAAHS